MGMTEYLESAAFFQKQCIIMIFVKDRLLQTYYGINSTVRISEQFWRNIT
jgi:hypothetical protein